MLSVNRAATARRTMSKKRAPPPPVARGWSSAGT